MRFTKFSRFPKSFCSSGVRGERHGHQDDTVDDDAVAPKSSSSIATATVSISFSSFKISSFCSFSSASASCFSFLKTFSEDAAGLPCTDDPVVFLFPDE